MGSTCGNSYSGGNLDFDLKRGLGLGMSTLLVPPCVVLLTCSIALFTLMERVSRSPARKTYRATPS